LEKGAGNALEASVMSRGSLWQNRVAAPPYYSITIPL